MSDEQNPFAMAARMAKAERIADVLRRFKATPEDVAEMSEEGWLLAAALADVPPPSDTTKAMVIGCLSMTLKTGRF